MFRKLFFLWLPVISGLMLLGLKPAYGASYLVNPGDRLSVAVWNEADLSGPVVVRPDGFISLPIAGEIDTTNNTLSEVSEEISQALSRYMKDAPQVVVSMMESAGNKIYIIGKVNRPGEYLINSETDIMQALALAGGLNTFAAGDDILVLRRQADGTQITIPFEYEDVEAGKNLETNIVLKSRDVVVVP